MTQGGGNDKGKSNGKPKAKRRRRILRVTRNRAPSTCEQDGREKNGRFAPGNRIALGNRAQRDRTVVRRAIRRCVSAEDYDAVIKQAVVQAKRGDRHAREFLASYADGRPRMADSEPVRVEGLPKIKTQSEALDAISVLIEKAGAGELNPDEALRLARLISAMRTTASNLESWDRTFPDDLPDPMFL